MSACPGATRGGGTVSSPLWLMRAFSSLASNFRSETISFCTRHIHTPAPSAVFCATSKIALQTSRARVQEIGGSMRKFGSGRHWRASLATSAKASGIMGEGGSVQDARQSPALSVQLSLLPCELRFRRRRRLWRCMGFVRTCVRRCRGILLMRARICRLTPPCSAGTGGVVGGACDCELVMCADTHE